MPEQIYPALLRGVLWAACHWVGRAPRQGSLSRVLKAGCLSSWAYTTVNTLLAERVNMGQCGPKSTVVMHVIVQVQKVEHRCCYVAVVVVVVVAVVVLLPTPSAHNNL